MWKYGVTAMLALGVGAVAVALYDRTSFHLIAGSMTYADLSATLLAAVSVMLTVLGLAIAAIAIFSISQLKFIARKAAQASAKTHIEQSTETGVLKEQFEAMGIRFFEKQLAEGSFRALVEERVDHIILTGSSHRARDQDLFDEAEEE